MLPPSPCSEMAAARRWAKRWAAIAVGFVGVLVVLRPGTEVFQPAALLPIAAAVGYAGLHMLRPKGQNTTMENIKGSIEELTANQVMAMERMSGGHIEAIDLQIGIALPFGSV